MPVSAIRAILAIDTILSIGTVLAVLTIRSIFAVVNIDALSVAERDVVTNLYAVLNQRKHRRDEVRIL